MNLIYQDLGLFYLYSAIDRLRPRILHVNRERFVICRCNWPEDLLLDATFFNEKLHYGPGTHVRQIGVGQIRNTVLKPGRVAADLDDVPFAAYLRCNVAEPCLDLRGQFSRAGVEDQ